MGFVFHSVEPSSFVVFMIIVHLLTKRQFCAICTFSLPSLLVRVPLVTLALGPARHLCLLDYATVSHSFAIISSAVVWATLNEHSKNRAKYLLLCARYFFAFAAQLLCSFPLYELWIRAHKGTLQWRLAGEIVIGLEWSALITFCCWNLQKQPIPLHGLSFKWNGCDSLFPVPSMSYIQTINTKIKNRWSATLCSLLDYRVSNSNVCFFYWIHAMNMRARVCVCVLCSHRLLARSIHQNAMQFPFDYIWFRGSTNISVYAVRLQQLDGSGMQFMAEMT